MGEILVILLVALVFLGPKELPKLAHQLGRAMGKLQKMQDEFTAEINSEGAQKQLKDNIAKAEDADDIYFRRDRQSPP